MGTVERSWTRAAQVWRIGRLLKGQGIFLVSGSLCFLLGFKEIPLFGLKASSLHGLLTDGWMTLWDSKFDPYWDGENKKQSEEPLKKKKRKKKRKEKEKKRKQNKKKPLLAPKANRFESTALSYSMGNK